MKRVSDTRESVGFSILSQLNRAFKSVTILLLRLFVQHCTKNHVQTSEIGYAFLKLHVYN